MLGKLLVAFLITLVATNIVSAAPPQSPKFPDLAEEFVYTTLSFSPTAAVEAGLHERTDPKTGKHLSFDEALDDFSPAEIARQRAYYADFGKRLRAIPKAGLDPQTQVDYELLENAVAFGLFSLDDEQFYRRKPQSYAENLGTALFEPMSLEYADKATRAAHLAARLEKVPAFIDRAMANLQASNEIYRKVALESNDGVISLIKELGPDFVKGTPSEERYGKAQTAALAALDGYAQFIKNELPKRGEFDWRMGAKRFDAKWRYYLQVSFSPSEMLRMAEQQMTETRAEMLKLAEPLHAQWFPNTKVDRSNADEYLNKIVGDVLAKIQSEHTGREQLFEQTERDAATIQDFIRSHNLLSMTEYPNLRIIPTPEFMRSSYGIAGAVFAPALEPKLATFYWVTPIPKEWTDEQAEGRLREYNKYKMLTLTVHEALPGHAVQGLYANRITPDWRRLLRTIYGNTPYVEGWAVYAERMMENLGLNGGDPVKMRLISHKAMLRVLTNAIIDIRLHTTNMSGQEAVDLMMTKGFQERPEAVGKLQRAQLDYVQLNTYFAGLREFEALRKEEERALGPKFSLCHYHDTVLLYGPIPVPAVRKLLLANVPPSAEPIPAACQ